MRYIKYLPILVLILLLSQCYELRSDRKSTFTFPHVLQNENFTGTIDTVHELEFFPGPFLGRYEFGDTVQLAYQTNHSYANPEHYYFHDFGQPGLDTLNFEGLSMKANANDTIWFDRFFFDDWKAYFPIYLVNESDDVNFLNGKDSHVSSTVEALYTDSTWRPVSSHLVPQCGNGRWTLKIKPEEFAVFLMPVYKGDFNTQMRVKLLNHDTVYVSNSFPASISKEQFVIKNEWMLKQVLNSEYDPIIFNGGIPIGSKE